MGSSAGSGPSDSGLRSTLAGKLARVAASQRATARALGVGLGTVQRDLGRPADPNGSPDPDAQASDQREPTRVTQVGHLTLTCDLLTRANATRLR